MGMVNTNYNAKWAEMQQAKAYAVADLEAVKKKGSPEEIAKAENNLERIKADMAKYDKETAISQATLEAHNGKMLDINA